MARLLALTATLTAPGMSRSQRRTVTTAWTEEQSQVTSSAPLAPAISAACASPHSSATTATRPSRASGGVSAANAARSAAVCAAALAPANAPTSMQTIPAISTTPTIANPSRVAPPCSPRVAGPRSPRAAGALTGRREAGQGRARGRRPRWP
jgi:hypothetical protein